MADDKTMARIRGLLEKAERTEFQAEADTLRAKAYELLAKHGIDEAQARAAGKGNQDSDALILLTFNVPEPYGEFKSKLLAGIIRALHSTGVRSAQDPNEIKVIGVRRNAERIKFLFPLLYPQMVSAASHSMPESFEHAAIVGHRQSFMEAFAQTVGQRLAEAEAKAARDADGADSTSTALVLLDDAERAKAALRKKFGPTSPGRVAHASSSSGYAAGAAAGARADVGHTRVTGRTAIGG